MNRGGLKFLAALLSTLIVVVLFAGFDNLPRDLRKQVGAERSALASTTQQVAAEATQVTRDLQTEAALFRSIPASAQYAARLAHAQSLLQSAQGGMDRLNKLDKANRRGDQDQVRKVLAEERNLRASSETEARTVSEDSAHWVNLKQRLPQTLQDMERDYRATQALNLAAVTSSVNKAQTDWPEKKADLDWRLAGLKNAAEESEKLWQSTAEARRQAAAGNLAALDSGALVLAADQLSRYAAETPAKAKELKELSGQLYDSWDKVLVDMETRGIGNSKEYDQKLRTVRTHLESSESKGGATTSEERWVAVAKPVYDGMKDKLGMAVEHKPAGKYDSEAERVAQPAGFAYMAPPSQGSNRYGYWDHRDGRDFWVFYGQYALMRDLLFNHDYRPLDRGEWDGYRTYQSRGQTYWGNDSASGRGAPKYGSQGAETQQRYSGSTFAQGGGFKDSRFATKGGSYRGSQYATPQSRRPDADYNPRTFGRNASPSTPRASPPPSRTFRSPSPRPSFRMPSGGSGRRFGRR
jgi:hypothetical protein